MPPCKEDETTKGGTTILLLEDPILVREQDRNHDATSTDIPGHHTTTMVDSKVDSKNDRNKNLWWIHGNGYDLEEFVQRHPGGREAILLGKGRDCTALVESYHAFSSGHHKILEKFLVEERNKKAPHQDYFYSLLKERVMVELKAHGLDPQADRGACWKRALYYALVFLAWLTTGYLHAAKVSLCSL